MVIAKGEVVSFRPAPQHARLKAKLRAVRAASGMSSGEFAKQLGWPTLKLSKVESGEELPQRSDVFTWLQAANALDESDYLIDLLNRAQVEANSTRPALSELTDLTTAQRRWQRRERQAHKLDYFVSSIIPGLLQTAAYARTVFSLCMDRENVNASANDIERMVNVRIDRQKVLYDPSKKLSFVVGEASLWSRYGNIETQIGQLNRLAAMLDLSNADLRILPFAIQMPTLNQHDFQIIDNRFVTIETVAGAQWEERSEDVDIYRRVYGQLYAASLAGDEAKQLIRHVARELTGKVKSNQARSIWL